MSDYKVIYNASRILNIWVKLALAISQVQGWLDELHARRQVLEVTFNRRKTQLEQCLALAILASDLKELENALQEGRELLKNTDQLGK